MAYIAGVPNIFSLAKYFVLTVERKMGLMSLDLGKQKLLQ